MNKLYANKDKAVFIDSENRFIYEVMVYLRFQNIVSLVKTKLYISKKEIPNIIETYIVNKYIDICCYLYAAPEEWLLNNDFIPYLSPKEIKKLKINQNGEQKRMPNKSRSRRTSS